MKKGLWSSYQRIFPFISLILLIIIFSIIVGPKFWSVDNLVNIINQVVPLILGGAGMIFVVTQGGCDLSQGSALALVGTIAAMASNSLGFIAYFPAAIFLGTLIGAFNGVIVSKFKVQSLMVTLAMMITLRAIVVYITGGQVIYVSSSVLLLDNFAIKISIFVTTMAVMYYLFEYTKIGFYSKVIGENEMVGIYSGISVDKYKILAFMISGIMAGIVGALTVGRIGGVDPAMGNFFELQVLMSLFVGGVPVTGGAGSKIYKLFIGALILSVLQNGLILSRVSAEVSELVEGIILIGVVFFTLYIRSKFIQVQSAGEN
ncbi:ABC transporter permease [Thermoanaerobacterium thermosaccharolyticum]|uniref:ABC transporter permease n=1 Tax=Thermoanaerobacterium thermosaccharolyticum TaxID=1517 RepID=UPI003DA86D84